MYDTCIVCVVVCTMRGIHNAYHPSYHIILPRGTIENKNEDTQFKPSIIHFLCYNTQ